MPAPHVLTLCCAVLMFFFFDRAAEPENVEVSSDFVQGDWLKESKGMQVHSDIPVAAGKHGTRPGQGASEVGGESGSETNMEDEDEEEYRAYIEHHGHRVPLHGNAGIDLYCFPAAEFARERACAYAKHGIISILLLLQSAPKDMGGSMCALSCKFRICVCCACHPACIAFGRVAAPRLEGFLPLSFLVFLSLPPSTSTMWHPLLLPERIFIPVSECQRAGKDVGFLRRLRETWQQQGHSMVLLPIPQSEQFCLDSA